MLRELTVIVLFAAGADHRLAVGENGEIALAVDRQIVLRAHLRRVEDHRHRVSLPADHRSGNRAWPPALHSIVTRAP
jgi:hypothetical protein